MSSRFLTYKNTYDFQLFDLSMTGQEEKRELYRRTDRQVAMPEIQATRIVVGFGTDPMSGLFYSITKIKQVLC